MTCTCDHPVKRHNEDGCSGRELTDEEWVDADGPEPEPCDCPATREWGSPHLDSQEPRRRGSPIEQGLLRW